MYKESNCAQYEMSTSIGRYEHNKDSRNKRREVVHNETKLSLAYSYVMRVGRRSTNNYNPSFTRR